MQKIHLDITMLTIPFLGKTASKDFLTLSICNYFVLILVDLKFLIMGIEWTLLLYIGSCDYNVEITSALPFKLLLVSLLIYVFSRV